MGGEAAEGLRVAIGAGGTGGHVMPALAVAEVLVASGHTVTFVGSRAGIEGDIVRKHAFEFHGVNVISRARGIKARNIKAIGIALVAIAKCVLLLRKVRPNVVLGMGGFASLPVALAAAILRVPLVIHEQNAVMGLANRVVGKFARKTLRGTDIGIPVRKSLIEASSLPNRTAALKHFDLMPDLPTLLIIGGSLGAQGLNRAIIGAFDEIAKHRVQVLHIYGERNKAEVEAELAGLNSPEKVRWRALPFTDRMDLALAVTDLCICRAGASTLAEIAIFGVPAALVPLPHSLDNDQLHNAKESEAAGAAAIVPERDLTPSRVSYLITEILLDDEVCNQMRVAARSLARPHAAARVAELLIEAART